MWSLIKLVLFIIVVVVLIGHWDVVVNFLDVIIDWIVYWIKIASVGPPEIPTP